MVQSDLDNRIKRRLLMRHKTRFLQQQQQQSSHRLKLDPIIAKDVANKDEQDNDNVPQRLDEEAAAASLQNHQRWRDWEQRDDLLAMATQDNNNDDDDDETTITTTIRTNRNRIRVVSRSRTRPREEPAKDHVIVANDGSFVFPRVWQLAQSLASSRLSSGDNNNNATAATTTTHTTAKLHTSIPSCVLPAAGCAGSSPDDAAAALLPEEPCKILECANVQASPSPKTTTTTIWWKTTRRMKRRMAIVGLHHQLWYDKIHHQLPPNPARKQDGDCPATVIPKRSSNAMMMLIPWMK